MSKAAGDRQSPFEFDLVLVVEYFRTTPQYLSIIAHLANKLRVAILTVDVRPGALVKNEEQQVSFVEECCRLGAKKVQGGHSLSTKLLIVPQRIFTPKALDEIRSVKAQRVVALLGLAYAGVPKFEAFIEDLGIRRLYVIDLAFYKFLAIKRGVWTQRQSYELIEVGLPFARYPVLNQDVAKYIVAMPTGFSFPTEWDKLFFLRNVHRILDSIGKDADIIYKPHNGQGMDYFRTKRHLIFGHLLSKATFFGSFFEWVRRYAPRIAGLLVGFEVARLYVRLGRRLGTKKLPENVKNIGLEFFLPHVTSGVIGGLSNTIWGTLYFRRQYYNCVAETDRNSLAVKSMYKTENRYLDDNLEYFKVPSCDGSLKFDPIHFDKISASCREADLLERIKADIASDA
jgi:hypothetical protein